MSSDTYQTLLRLLSIASQEEILKIKESVLSEQKLNNADKNKAIQMIDTQLSVLRECA